MDFNERTSFAMDISRKAGKRILEIQDSELHIKNKDEDSHAAVDIVTIADTESEKVIFSALEKLFPDDGFIGEEGTNKASKNGYVWVVDPLDGTMNFSCQLPIYGVSVGYMYNSKPYGGAIYMPKLDDMYVAESTKGAYLNNKKINVSDNSEIKKSRLSIGSLSKKASDTAWFNNTIAQINAENAVFYNFYCVIMSMTGLASGKFDGNIIKGPALWDICAGAIIVEEAGGKLVKFDGSPIDYKQIENHELLATNGTLDLKKLVLSLV